MFIKRMKSYSSFKYILQIVASPNSIKNNHRNTKKYLIIYFKFFLAPHEYFSHSTTSSLSSMKAKSFLHFSLQLFAFIFADVNRKENEWKTFQSYEILFIMLLSLSHNLQFASVYCNFIRIYVYIYSHSLRDHKFQFKRWKVIGKSTFHIYFTYSYWIIANFSSTSLPFHSINSF